MSTDEMVSVRYLVDDVAAATEFYVENFAFTVGMSAAPAFAEVRRGNLRLLLSGPLSSAGRAMADGEVPCAGGWNRLHFVVPDITTEIERLRANGVAFRNEVVHGPGGSQVLLFDPAGNLIELFQAAAR